jgi:hypothetical protein
MFATDEQAAYADAELDRLEAADQGFYDGEPDVIEWEDNTPERPEPLTAGDVW